MALSYAGGVAAMILFAIIPSIIALKRRIGNKIIPIVIGSIGFLIIVFSIFMEIYYS